MCPAPEVGVAVTPVTRTAAATLRKREVHSGAMLAREDGMRWAALFILACLASQPARADGTRQRYYFKHVDNLHDKGERLTPHWCKKLLDAGSGNAIRLDEEGAAKERLLQRAWRKVGAPQGLPSRLNSIFAARHPKDWGGEMSKCFVYGVQAPRGAKVTVRDARYGLRCFAALQRYTRAEAPGTKRRWLAVAWRAAKDYWRKPGTAPGAWPEVLIEGGATVAGTLNEPKVNAYLHSIEPSTRAPLPPYRGTPPVGGQQKGQQSAPGSKPAARPFNPLMLNPFFAFWFGN
jgi:hypothetical protein